MRRSPCLLLPCGVLASLATAVLQTAHLRPQWARREALERRVRHRVAADVFPRLLLNGTFDIKNRTGPHTARDEGVRQSVAFRGAASAVASIVHNHEPSEPPLQDGQHTVDVAVGFKANKLIVLDQNERTVTWAGWFRRYWYDPRLKYNGTSLAGNGSSWAAESFVQIRPDTIWRPDITVSNAVDFNWEELCDQPDAFLYDAAGIDLDITERGARTRTMKYNVMWSQPCVIKAKCDIDIKLFPFDTSVCPLIFEPWGQNFLQMGVAVGAIESEVSTPEFNVTVDGSTVKRVVYSSMHGSSWPQVSVNFRIARYAHYYVVNFICPILLMIVLTWISFWIPAHTSDRIQYMVTIVLTVMAVNFITSEKRPATDVDTWLDDFQSRTLLLVVVTTFYTVWFYCLVPPDTWDQVDRERRMELLRTMDKLIRLVFPLVVLLWLGRLFTFLFSRNVRGIHSMGICNGHFSGNAASQIFVGLFFMSLLLCMATFARMHEIVEDKVRSLEDWHGRSASSGPIAFIARTSQVSGSRRGSRRDLHEVHGESSACQLLDEV